MANQIRKQVVISIHGIRTDGYWQKTLEDILRKEEIIHKPFNYGKYNIWQFLRTRSNDKIVERFYEFYSAVEQAYGTRPSVVAHSFGTYVVGYCLLKRPHIKLNKLILCGSILPEKFDWSTLLARNQINQMLNESSKRDFWVRIAKYFVSKTGLTGYVGLAYKSANFFQRRLEYKHSDYFTGNHMRQNWIPFLIEPAPTFEIEQGRDLTLAQQEEALAQCRKIDLEFFKEGANIPLFEDISQKWLSVNGDLYTFCFKDRTNEIVGYINAIPVSDQTFESIKSGFTLDEEIMDSDVIPFTRNQKLKMYFLAISTKPDMRHYRGGLINVVGERLFAAFFYKLMEYWKNDRIMITEFLATAWTPPGQKICEELGMKEIGKDKYGHPIYWSDLSNIAKSRKGFMQGFDNLLNAYKKG